MKIAKNYDFNALSRFQFQRIYFTLGSIWFLCMWFNSVLFSQLNDPPMTTMFNDLTYFLLNKIHFFDLIIHSPALSLTFDIVLFLTIISLIFSQNKLLPKVFLILYSYYFLTFFFYSGSHGHWVGIFMTCWLFTAESDKRFAIFYEIIRYYILFHFAIAGVYKMTHTAIYNVDGFAKTIFGQNAIVIFENPDSWRSLSVLYLSNHPLLAHSFLIGGTILELLFLVGFFTKKYDIYLFFGVLLFMLLSLFFMNIIFYEMPFFALFLALKVKPDFQYFVHVKENDMIQV